MKKLFLIFLFLLIACPAWSATYYVATAGNDSCNGTSPDLGTSGNCSWKTVTKANTKTFLAGDSLLFNRGDTFTGVRLTMDESGTAVSPITIGAYGTGNKPIIDANGAVTYAIYTAAAQNVTIDNIQVANATTSNILAASNVTISNVTSTGGAIGIYVNGSASSISGSSISNSTGSKSVYVKNATSFSISSSTVTNNNAPMYFEGCSNVVIDTVTVSGSGGAGVIVTKAGSGYTISNLTSTGNGDEGLVFYNSDASVLSNITISDSSFTDNIGNGLGFKGTGNSVKVIRTSASSNHADGFNAHDNWTGIVFDRCVANSNGYEGLAGSGDGYTLHENCTATVQSSTADNNEKSAVATVGASSIDINYCLFTHTTNGALGMIYVSGSGVSRILNNTIYSPAHTGYAIKADGGTVTVQNNIVSGFDTGIIKNSGTIIEDYNIVYGATTAAFSGFTEGAHSSESDPLFISATNYHLQSGSPAKGSGVNIGLSSKNPPDIGAEPYIQYVPWR
jgi:hypothetical protein